MRRLRRLTRKYICLDFLAHIAWEVGVCVVGVIGICVAIFTGDTTAALNTGGRVVLAACALLFVWWVATDAKKAADRLCGKPSEKDSLESSDTETQQPEDVSQTAGLHERPPWMG
ncbi:hypothetical protein OAS39_04550 [Pirellulales bacterium]|nr:hypothetical protein [Pirellulales bacterium]